MWNAKYEMHGFRSEKIQQIIIFVFCGARTIAHSKWEKLEFAFCVRAIVAK